jgi:hypothetical protein
MSGCDNWIVHRDKGKDPGKVEMKSGERREDYKIQIFAD